MTVWRGTGIVLLTVFATLAVLGGLLARNGLSAAGQPLTTVEHRALYQARKAVVALSAEEMRNPFADRRNVWKDVAGEFAEHCAMCHGPAGRGDATLGATFYPPPPDLTRASTQNLSDGELYHIISEGIRFTGMPAWSASHGSDELWRYVTLVRQLPSLTKEELTEAGGHGASTHH